MRFSGFLKPVLMLGCLLLAQTAYAGHFLYTGGHYIDPDRIGLLGYTYDQFPGNDAGFTAAFAGEYGNVDAIVIGESGASLSPGMASTVATWVSHGGRLVVINNHQGSTDITNQIMGYAVEASYGCESGEDISSALQTTTATGTAFVSGAPNLRNLSCTGALVRTSLPTAAKSMYSGTGTSQAFTTKVGTGQFAWLGWDYCCGSAQYMNDWYHLLATAMAPSFKVCAGAGYTGAKLILCQQICEVRQTPSVKATLIRGFNTAFHSAPSCAVELPLTGGGD